MRSINFSSYLDINKTCLFISFEGEEEEEEEEAG
jgi:hypothetical protein